MLGRVAQPSRGTQALQRLSGSQTGLGACPGVGGMARQAEHRPHSSRDRHGARWVQDGCKMLAAHAMDRFERGGAHGGPAFGGGQRQVGCGSGPQRGVGVALRTATSGGDGTV